MKKLLVTLLVLSASASQAQSTLEVWGAGGDDYSVILSTFVDATGARVAATSPSVTIKKIDQDGTQTMLVNAAAMTAVSGVTGDYLYVFSITQTDSGGVAYTASVSGTVSGIVTGKSVVFRRADWMRLLQTYADAAISSRSTSAALATAQADLDDPAQYKADVSALATSAALATAQADLDNPDQYKADVSGLATSAALTTAQADLDNPTQYKADVSGLATSVALAVAQADLDNPNQYKADVAGLATSLALATAQADLDNPNQYKADVSGLAVPGDEMALTAPTHLAVVGEIWDEPMSDPTVPGSTKEALANASAGGGATADLGELVVSFLDVHPPGQELLLTASFNVDGAVTLADLVQYTVLRDEVVVLPWENMPPLAGITGLYGAAYTLGDDGTYTVVVRATEGGKTTQGIGAFIVHRGRFLRR